MLLIVSFNSAYAIDPPPDNAKPPAAIQKADEIADEKADEIALQKQAPKEDVMAFAGLATASLPDMLADHLDIDRGTGVIVRTLYPDGPAEKAGLAANDIILSVGDDSVENPQAFSTLIRQHEAGDELELQVIHRGGDPKKIKLTLEERPVELMAQLDQEPLLDGVPQPHMERLRGMLDQNMRGFGNQPDLGMGFPDSHLDDAMRMMRERMEKAPFDNGEKGNGLRFQQNSTIRMMDDQGAIEIKSSGGNTEVIVRDPNNEIVWEGAWNTEQDKAEAPEGIRERIDRVGLSAGKGFLRFRNIRPDTIDN